MTSTSFYNGYSTMNFEWDRPRDAINSQGDSCIKGYDVGIYRVSQQNCQQQPRRPTQTHTAAASGAGSSTRCGQFAC